MNRPYSLTVLLALIFLLLIGLAVTTAAASDVSDLPHFSADPSALYNSSAHVTPAEESDVVVLNDEETVIFDATGKSVHTRYALYKILTRTGAEQWSDLAISWEPWHQERPTIRARVITADLQVHPLDARTISESPVQQNQSAVFSDRRLLRVPLPAIAPGSLVEEEQVSTDTSLFFAAGTTEQVYFANSVPVMRKRLVLDAPAGLPLRYDLQLLPNLKPQRSETDGRLHITFDYGPMEALNDVEPGLPSDVPAYPTITFSTGTSWQQIAQQYADIVDKQIGSADLTTLVLRLVAGKESRDARISAILQYIAREVRYTGIEFGDAAIVPHSPSETLTRKYGDCKDKAALLVAMLRTAQVPAYLALLNAGSRLDVAPDLPGMGLFDHAIVYVPGDLWIDPTDEYARLGVLPSSDVERLALIVRPETTALQRIPAVPSAANALIETREIQLAEYGPARITEVTQPTGSFESGYRRSYADRLSKKSTEELTNYVKAQYSAETLDHFEYSESTDFSKPFKLTLESNRAKRGFTDLDSAVAVIRLESLFARLPADLRQRQQQPKSDSTNKKPKPTRTADYQLAEAFVTEWQYTISPPPGFQSKELPKNLQLPLGPAALHEEFTTDNDGVVHASLHFDTVKRRFTASEAAAMRDGIVSLLEGQPIIIYFDSAAQLLLNQGKVKEALQSYRELAKAHPGEALHHLQVAQTLLAAGLGEAARAEARAATQLEPDSALAQKTLADILEYDLVGRKFRPGSDFAGAEAAFRAAEKLDPADNATIANFAILLEYNQWGLRYGPGSKLKEAIAEYRKVPEETRAELGVQNNLAFTLFYDGQFSEARKAAQALTPQLGSIIVACQAVLDGSPAALAEARKLSTGEENFRALSANAGEMLENLQRFVLAADLVEAGASGDNASESAAYAALYRKARPHQQLVFADDPADVTVRFELLTHNPDVSLEMLRSITSRNGNKTFATQHQLEAYSRDARQRFSRWAREGAFPDPAQDLVVARAQPKVQGNDTTGYKVTLFASASYKTSFYVVRENGRYLILAKSSYPASLGLEVLDRVASHDLSGARVLLDWLREDQHLAGGDDPLTSDPFPLAWTQGKESDAMAMRLAAATILTGYKDTAADGLKILEQAASSGQNQRLDVLLALAEGYFVMGKLDQALTTWTTLSRLYPDSIRAFSTRCWFLRALGRSVEADAVAEEHLKKFADDVHSMRILMLNAVSRADYSTARSWAVKAVNTSDAAAQDWNSLAWLSLFIGNIQPSDVDAALKAAQLGNKDAASLHTLGCIYSQAGKTREAREVLIQAMDSLSLDEPDSNYWYAFGLIAEQYGEYQVGIADYNRVNMPDIKDDGLITWSSYHLAQQRLKALLPH